MATESSTSFDCEKEVTCLKTQVAALEERDDALNERLCAVEDAVKVEPFMPGLFAYGADMGLAGAEQAAIANMVLGWGGTTGCLVDGFFMCGDNNYPSGALGTQDANFVNFAAFEDAGVIRPVLGNHERDTTPIGENLIGRFPELFVDDDGDPSERGYYTTYFDNGDVQFYALNDGMDSGYFTDPAPPFDGNFVGSAQYQWLIKQRAASKARHHIVGFHHPYVTSVGEGDWPPRYLSSMNWKFQDLGIDLALVGHTHTNSHIRHSGFDILDVSMTVQPSRVLSTTWLGGNSEAVAGSYNVWQDLDGAGDTSEPAIAKIIAEKNRLTVQVFRVSDGTKIHEFVI